MQSAMNRLNMIIFAIPGEREGAWAYVEGGMGGVSNAIAKCGLFMGLDIKTEAVCAHMSKT